MDSYRDIYDQIRILQNRLTELSSVLDPAFTPRELVRWDPTLVGTLLHCEHASKIKRSLLGPVRNVSDELRLEQFGVLTNDGLCVPDEIAEDTSLVFHTLNTLESMTRVPIQWRTHRANLDAICARYGIDTGMLTQTENRHGVASYTTGYVPISNKNTMLHDIYVASYVKIPCHEKEFVVDKYPLLRLYEEWRQDKALGNSKRNVSHGTRGPHLDPTSVKSE